MARYFPDRRALSKPFSQSPGLSSRGGFGVARSRTPMFGRSPGLRGGFSSSGERGIGGRLGASRVRPAPSPLLGAVNNISQTLGGGVETTPQTTVINRLVNQRVQNILPSLTNKIERQVNTFDPGDLLNKVFKGGITELEKLGSAITSIIKPLKRVFTFLTDSSKILTKLIKKLLTGGRSGGPSFGLKNLLGLAMPMMAAASTFMAMETMQRAQKEPTIDQDAPIDELSPTEGGQRPSRVDPDKEGSSDSLPGQLTTEELDVFNQSVKRFNKLLDGLIKAQLAEKPTQSSSGSSSATSTTPMAAPPTPPPGPGGPGGDVTGTPGAISKDRFTIGDSVAMLKGLGASDEEAQRLSVNMKYESSGDPTIDTVKSGLDPTKSNEYSIGLYQINWKAHKNGPIARELGITNEDQLRDPVTNAMFAIKLYRSQGNAAWSARSKVTNADRAEASQSLQGWQERYRVMGGQSPYATGTTGGLTEPTTVQPDTSTTQQQTNVNAQVISRDAASVATGSGEPIVNNTVVEVPAQPQPRPPKMDAGPSQSAVQVPFFLSMKEDIHIMYSKIVYNVVDAS
jgi:hypothetical protein